MTRHPRDTRHPSDDALVRWLETGRPRRVGRHVEDCEVCLERLELVSGLDGGLLTGLESASAPPSDLHARTTGGVSDRLAAEEALASVLELFTVPWRTATSILDPAPITADPAGSTSDSGRRTEISSDPTDPSDMSPDRREEQR